MKRTIVALAITAAALVGAIAVSAHAADSSVSAREHDQDKVRARLIDAAGNDVGKVTIEARRDKTTVEVEASGLAPGFHGFHVHAIGVCDAATGYTSAGSHYNPGGTSHAGHAGDMPPLLVNADGTAEQEFVTDRFTAAELLDSDGSAIIVHAGPDNLGNVPTRYHSHTPDASSTIFGPDAATLATGDSGARAACGVLRGKH